MKRRVCSFAALSCWGGGGVLIKNDPKTTGSTILLPYQKQITITEWVLKWAWEPRKDGTFDSLPLRST